MSERCSERVFSGTRMDTGGHSCGTPASTKEDGKWWCWRHTKEGKKAQQTAQGERTKAYLDDIHHKVEYTVEAQRRCGLFPDLLETLAATAGYLHKMAYPITGDHSLEFQHCRATICERARAIIEKAKVKP